MQEFISEDAHLAVKRGINWLDDNHPQWAEEINLNTLDMADCYSCIIGQAVGNYSRIVSMAVNRDFESIDSTIWAVEHGFEAPSVLWERPEYTCKDYGYEDLDTLWTEEVRNRLG